MKGSLEMADNMVYIKVPTEPRIMSGESKEECDKLSALCIKYGYKITFFGHDDITFYLVSDLDSEGFVPIHSRYCMNRREFAAFHHLIARLEVAERKANELLIEWATQKSLNKR